MKKRFLQIKFTLVALLMFMVGNNSWAQVSLASWTFPVAITPATTTYAAECGVYQSSGMIYLDGTNGSSDWEGGGPIAFFTGTIPATPVCEVSTATLALSLVNTLSAHNDSGIVFKFPTTGYTDLMLSYSSRGTSTGFQNHVWSHSVDGVNFTDDTTFTGRQSTTFSNLIVDLSDVTELDNQPFVYIKLTVSGATGTGNNRFDNINFTATSNIATVAQPSFSVTSGNYCAAQTVTITCDTANAEIYYTLDGSTPDELTGLLYTTPIQISTTTTLKAIAYRSDLAASVIRTATYTLPTAVADIATFKAGNAGDFYKLTGDVVVTYQNGSYLYVQDATAGLLIYSAGLDSYNNGDVISGGICGTYTLYSGVVELTNPQFENPVAVAGAQVLPIEVSMNDLLANWNTYDSKLIQLSNVNFAAGTFGQSIVLYQGVDSLSCYDQYGSLTGMVAPTNTAMVIGMAIYNNQLCRIAPRHPSDIIEMMPSVEIVTPIHNYIYEESQTIAIDVTTQFFEFEDGKMIKFDLTGTIDTTIYCNSAAMLSFIESTTFPFAIGNYTLYVSLINADSSDFNPIVIDSAAFSIQETYVAIEATPSIVTYTANGETHTINVTGFNLTENITLTCDNTDFTLSANTLPALAVDSIVSITYNGTTNTSATLTLTSGSITSSVALNVLLPIDQVYYSTGFEPTDGFVAGTAYNLLTPTYGGDVDHQWGTIYGTASTTSPIFGAQSMQMRWYTTAPDNIGYTYTEFDVPNATKVEFFAKNTNSINVSVSYSVDGGSTYAGDSIIELQLNTANYTYFISDSGQYDYVRVKFAISLPTPIPSGTSRLYIDSVIIYNVPGLEPTTVSTPAFSLNEGNYFVPQNVEITCATHNASIYYTMDGTAPDSTTGTLYSTPINITTTTTLKAIAYKVGMDSSNVAVSTYTFPTEVADIAAFKAANENLGTNTVPYKITGDVTFVYRSGRYIYIQDETAGLLVYDNQTSMITNSYVEGDVISGGVIGTYTLYNGTVEMIPLLDWNASTSNLGTIIPTTITALEMTDNFAAYESKLVRINNVTYTDDGTFSTASATSIVFVQGENEVTARNQFKTLDTTIAANSIGCIVGFAAIYDIGNGATMQMYPRTNADLFAEAEELSVPVFSPAGGTYDAVQNVTLSTEVVGASIYYTIDGTEPTNASTLYVDPILVDRNMTIKAITYLDGVVSEVATEDYVILIGINEAEYNAVNIYPNPVMESLTINAESQISGRVEILNAYGQVVYRNDSPVYPLTISMQNNANGLYFVRILNTDNSIIVKKITKL